MPVHARLRPFNTRDTYPEQKLDNDLRSRDYSAGLFQACGMEPRTASRSRSFEFIRGMVGHGLGYSLHNVPPCTDVAYDGNRVAALPIREALTPVRIMRLRLRRGAMRPAA